MKAVGKAWAILGACPSNWFRQLFSPLLQLLFSDEELKGLTAATPSCFFRESATVVAVRQQCMAMLSGCHSISGGEQLQQVMR